MAARWETSPDGVIGLCGFRGHTNSLNGRVYELKRGCLLHGLSVWWALMDSSSLHPPNAVNWNWRVYPAPQQALTTLPMSVPGSWLSPPIPGLFSHKLEGSDRIFLSSDGGAWAIRR